MNGPRLLVCVAHPDDETYGCGSLLLHAAHHGWRTSVCCATRGEAGDPAAGSGITRDALPQARERELRDAAGFLGVEQIALFDHRDSGMAGDPAPGALVAVPLGELAGQIQAALERLRPQIVVTLDGSDGHRDHAHIRDATIRAVEQARWRVDRLYLQCLPRSLLRRWADHRRTIDPDSPYLDVAATELGTPDDRITTTIDTSPWLAQRWEAIALHRSQRSPYEDLPEQLASEFLTTEHLRQLLPVPGGARAELDPFAATSRGRSRRADDSWSAGARAGPPGRRRSPGDAVAPLGSNSTFGTGSVMPS